jgi:endogenous inhibitor of DNA gyrase (YacG/DUF329 family)
MSQTAKVKCPTCKKTGAWFAGSYGPFCSRRCKLIDLGKWFAGEHIILTLRPGTGKNTNCLDDYLDRLERVNNVGLRVFLSGPDQQHMLRTKMIVQSIVMALTRDPTPRGAPSQPTKP